MENSAYWLVMRTIWVVKAFNRFEKQYETLAMCDDCLVKMETEYGDKLYQVVAQLRTSVECENEFCEHRYD